MEERLSYKLIGGSYEVYNQLGYGHKEVIYQRAYESWLTLQKLSFKRELPYTLLFNGNKIGSYKLDFLVNDAIALEFKVAVAVHRRFINQLLNYLSETNKRLGICVVFTPEGVIIKRVANGSVDDL